MITYYLQITLLSDTTFGRGDGVAGLVDEEIEHDPRYGLPYLKGRTLKGLLTEECANLLYSASSICSDNNVSMLEEAARNLFGAGGSTAEDDAYMRVGDAVLPEKLRTAVQADVDAKRLSPADVLESLTTIRRQTSMTSEGIPEDGSLRSMRVLLRETTLIAPLRFHSKPSSLMLALLGACAAALRRGGTGRNRGRGKFGVRLWGGDTGPDLTNQVLEYFENILKGTPA